MAKEYHVEAFHLSTCDDPMCFTQSCSAVICTLDELMDVLDCKGMRLTSIELIKPKRKKKALSRSR